MAVESSSTSVGIYCVRRVKKTGVVDEYVELTELADGGVLQFVHECVFADVAHHAKGHMSLG